MAFACTYVVQCVALWLTFDLQCLACLHALSVSKVLAWDSYVIVNASPLHAKLNVQCTALWYHIACPFALGFNFGAPLV